jgi:uncharacterized protein with ATP-grasp and redox domains
VEAERARLIEGLTAKLTQQEIDTLLAQSLAYRSGQVRYADFYTGLKTLCRRKGIDLTAYPAMNEYVQYVLLADGVDVETLTDELAEEEKAAYGALAKSGEERDLIAESRWVWRMGKLVDFALTPVEWREYKSAKNDVVAAAGPAPALASFESFYHEADARDAAIAKNVIAAVSQAAGSPSLAAVLVTGGYHADGIAKTLTAGGFTVVSYVPKIEKVDTDRGSAYLSVFTQEKTPLDRLFQGQKLHLANAPVKPADIQLALPGLIAVADNAETFGSIRKSFLSLVPPALTARFKKIVEKSSEEMARLSVFIKDGWVFTVQATPGTSSEDHRFMMEVKKESLNPLRRFGERLFVLPATHAAALQEERDVLNKLDFSGRATSRWMTKIFEFVGGRRGGVEGARQAGAHYKAHAPAYEWSLGFAMAVANIGAVLFLAGTAWALVPLLLTALFLPSHVLPARWLKTEVKVGWAKAGLMGLFYFALVAVAPLLALDFGWTQGFLQTAGWGLTLALHRRFDPGVNQPHRRDFFGRPLKTDRDIGGLPFSYQPTIVLGKEGIHPGFGSTRPNPETGPTRTARGPPTPEVAAETSPLVSKDYVPGIYRENDLVEKFPDVILQIQRWGREAVIDRQLRLLVLNGELDKSREEELKNKARALLAEAEGAEGFNPTTMERNVLVCEIVRKVVAGKAGSNPFSVRNLKTNNIAAALQENGLPLRRRLLRLLHSFEALKYMTDEELYNQEEETISKNLLERVRSFDDRALAIDAFDSYTQRVVRSRKPITVPVFFDDNGEAVFALRFILDQMLLNPHLRFVLVARNGQFREDASVNDLHRILKLPVFRKDVQSVGNRLRVMAGCAGDGIDARKFSPELVQTLLSADVVLSIGQMNFENLNTFKKDVYFLFVTHAVANAAVSGVPVGKGIFAFLPAGTRAFSGYTDSSFRRFQYGDGPAIPVAGKTLIETARGFPENRINENFVIVDNPEKGKNQGGSPSSNSGRATSRWMTRLFERLGFHWGGETSAERWGAHYKAHAPAYEWSLGFAMAVANIGAVLFLAGTAWALVPLLLTVLFLPSHVLPARWLKTEIKVGWVKAGLLAVFYFALVAIAPLLAMEFSWTQGFLQAVGWRLTLTLHHRFDPGVDQPHRRGFFGRPLKTDRDIGGLPFSDQPTIVLGKRGIRLEFVSTRPNPETGPTRTARGPPTPEVAAETSPLVSKDYVPGIYRENDLVEKFPEEISKNQRWSRGAVIDRQLRLLVLNGELDESREEELKNKARALLAEAEGAEGFNPTTMERTVLACNIVKKVVKGKAGFNPFVIRNENINNVAAALQENGLPLRQRFLRLLHSFEALKQIPNVVLYNIENQLIADTLWERVRSFDDRTLAIDAFDSYAQRVVRSRKPITVPVFFDDNGEAVFALRFILDQMLLNPHLRFVLVARNGQFREDASVNDLHRILKLPVFRKDVQSVGNRLRVMAGCAGDGIDARKFSPELVQTLLSADVVLSIGQMNFEGLNTFKKDVYFLFVPNALGNTAVSGVPAGKGIFAFLPAGTRAFSGYTDSSFRRFQYGDGPTIPVAGKTLIETARGFPENRINEHFAILENPVGENRQENTPNPSDPGGRATSRWMTRTFEWFGALWGGEGSARRWGAHYKAHAPAYEWSLGFAMAAANIGAVLFLAGTAWALVPLLLTALFLPSHILPAGWLKTEIKVGWVKAGLMGLFYFALVAAAPLLAMEFSWTQAFFQAAGWGLTFVLHRRFDAANQKPPLINRVMANPSPPLVNGLTTDQQRFAAQVTAIVGGKPTLLGLEDYMYGAAQAAVLTAAVGGEIAGTRAPSFKGTPVLFVDARSVATKKQRTALASFLKGKPDAVVFTNADDLNIAGADVRVRPKVFSPLSTIEEDLPSGVVEVALAPLGAELRGLSQGRGLQLFQTPALKLNSLGADETVTEAAKRSWLFSDLFTLLTPALVPEKWDEVLKVLTAIARSA